MHKKYIVCLSAQERQACTDVIKKLKGSSQKVRRAQLLLKADADGPAWTDGRIAEAFNCRVQTIENLRKRLVTEGFALALEGKKRVTPPTPPRLDGQGEAKLIAMRLGTPPAGYGRWTLQLLADALVALELVASISIETVRKTLKKNGMTKRMIAYWVIPPEADAELVAGMDDVLATYAKAYDPAHPVLCMDEQPVQLIRETRPPFRRHRLILHASTMNTSAQAPPASLCLPNRLRGFGKPPRGRSARKWTGRSRWHMCSTPVMPTASG